MMMESAVTANQLSHTGPTNRRNSISAVTPFTTGGKMPIDLPFVVSTLMTLLVSPLLLPFVVIRWLMTSFLWLAELTIACCHYKRAPVKPGDGCALVTGASSGLGRNIALLLAKGGYDLIVVARREDLLLELAEEVAQATRGPGYQRVVQVHVMPVDLLETDVATRLLDRVKQLGLQVSILVNNAGVAAPAAPFLDQDASSVARLFQLNSTVPSLLMHAFAPDMVAAGRGHILNISSGMGCTPGPTVAAYSASKALLNSMSRALDYELRGTGVSVTASCPGWLGGNDLAGSENALGPKLPLLQQQSAQCAQQSVDAMFASKPVVYAGTSFLTVWTLCNVLPLFPERYVNWLANTLWTEVLEKSPSV